jgi:hypothetical protein
LVTQGDIPTGVGFVRRGGVIEIVNRDAEYHNLHGRGAAFFALPLLERDRVQTRTLKEGGIVDLTCGAGYYWMHAHLFVVEHPYYVCTDVEGRFSLDRVPAGRYDVVCWVPNWRVLREERDPETGIIARLQWAQPVQQTQSVRVEPAVVTAAAFHWTKAAFE